MTCEQVRELLPDHLLGSLDDLQDAEVRRHLRGCAACREERAELEDGVEVFSRAVHDVEPPPELRDRVLATLAEEWRDTPVVVPETTAVASPPAAGSRRPRWLAAVAVAAVLVAAFALVWGGTQSHRADLAAQDAFDYRNVLHTLGGRDFRVSTLAAHTSDQVTGQALVYDGMPGGSDRSWAIVLLRSPGGSGTAVAKLVGPGGASVALSPMTFAEDGDASGWTVSSSDLSRYHQVVVRDADGTLLASGTLSSGDR